LGTAYAGPATLNLRKELASKSPAVASVKHGERLEIVETRRRFVHVRASNGADGWTDANLLLTSQQMDELKTLAQTAAKLPSQGAATAYDVLNVHAEPSRQSPSFIQIPEGGSVEVVGHQVTPRIQAAQRAVPVRRTTTPKKAKGKPKAVTYLLPLPAPPPAPRNWEQMSRPRAEDLPGYQAKAAAPPPALDAWSLVRTRDGNAGWVLARMLVMSIPDEVAQYAEGHHITAYVPLGDVNDGDQVKHNWLWTTAVSDTEPSEFDSFRVFVWSSKRHRYETAFIDRNATGYYPVLTENDGKGFSVIIREKDGGLYKRTYEFSGYRVKLVSKQPYQSVEAPQKPETAGAMDAPLAPVSVPAGWWKRVTARTLAWFHR